MLILSLSVLRLLLHIHHSTDSRSVEIDTFEDLKDFECFCLLVCFFVYYYEMEVSNPSNLFFKSNISIIQMNSSFGLVCSVMAQEG